MHKIFDFFHSIPLHLNHVYLWMNHHAEQVGGAGVGIAAGAAETGGFSDLRHIGFIFLCGVAGGAGGTVWKLLVKKCTPKDEQKNS